MTSPYTRTPAPGLYRSTTDRVLAGVCGGIAEYFQFSPFGVRAAVAITFLLTGFFPVVVLYIAAALIMKPRPSLALGATDRDGFASMAASSRSAALERARARFDELDQRIQRMESVVTSSRFDLDEQYRRM